MLAVATSAIIGVVQIVVGVWFRLASVASEGVHTLVDMADSLFVWWTMRVATSPPDRSHPFGHGKFESLGAVAEGAVIGVTGVAIMANAVRLLLKPEIRPQYSIPVVVAMGAAAVVYGFVSWVVQRLARKTRSPGLAAEAAHLRTHVYVTAGMFVGLGAGRIFGWAWADAVLALVVGMVLVHTAYHVLRPGVAQLTDEAMPEGDLRRLALLLDEFREEFVEVHHVRSRVAGVEQHVDLHLVLEPDRTVREAHDLCERIEQRVRQVFPELFLTIHTEPAGGQLGSEESEKRVHLPVRRPDEREHLHG